jgi:hypothetical protein
MRLTVQKIVYSSLIMLLLVSEFGSSARAANEQSLESSGLDAYTLMLAAHAFLGADLDELTQNDKTVARLASIHLVDNPTSNPLEIRLRQIENMCTESRQTIQSNYTGTELCERLAITDQVCAREIKSLQTALERTRRGRGLQTFFRRTLRRIDPGRANFGKLLRFIRHEVLPEAAQQIVTGALGGSNVMARRVLRQTFIRKARQVIKANLSTDLLMSGVPTETIQEIGLPAPQDVDLNRIKISRNIDLQAIQRECQKQVEREPAPSQDQTVESDKGPDMIEKWMDRTAIILSCKMPTHYFGTSYIAAGAPEWFDVQIEFDLKEGDVTYIYDYDAEFVDNGYYENSHHGEGKGDYIGDGWFSGVEQNNINWYQYYLNIETGEEISSGAEEIATTYNFIGALMDDMSQGVFCRAYGNTNEEIRSVGKDGLLNWNSLLCNPCAVEIR